MLAHRKKDMSKSLLVALALWAGWAAVAQADFQVRIETDGTATVTNYVGAGGAVVIPDVIDGWPVGAIGSRAFQDCVSLRSIALSSGVTNVDAYAFSGCIGLTGIQLPDSVRAVGSRAFQGCLSLTTADLGDGVATIGSYAFYGCSGLTQATLGSGTRRIDVQAFYGCTRLTDLRVPAGVTNVQERAFDGCARLTNIAVEAGSTAFSSIDGTLFNGDGTTLIQHPSGRSGAYAIPAGVTNVGNYAFWSQGGLTAVRFRKACNPLDTMPSNPAGSWPRRPCRTASFPSAITLSTAAPG